LNRKIRKIRKEKEGSSTPKILFLNFLIFL